MENFISEIKSLNFHLERAESENNKLEAKVKQYENERNDVLDMVAKPLKDEALKYVENISKLKNYDKKENVIVYLKIIDGNVFVSSYQEVS